MSQALLQKSDHYLDSARFLTEAQFWCASVHCSYYACLQAVKHILYKRKGRAHIDRELKNRDSHVYLIDNIVSLYAGTIFQRPDLKSSNPLEIDLNTDLHELKAKRKVADYDESFISEDDCRSAYASSKYIVTMLSTIYLSQQ